MLFSRHILAKKRRGKSGKIMDSKMIGGKLKCFIILPTSVLFNHGLQARINTDRRRPGCIRVANGAGQKQILCKQA